MKKNKKVNNVMQNKSNKIHSLKAFKKDQGFILVTVLLLTMMAGTVVLTSLKDSTVQERLSGNFQKTTNARMMAEKGVYDAYNAMNSTLQVAGENNVENTAEVVAAAFGNSNNMNDVVSISVTDSHGHTMNYDVIIKTSSDDSSLADDEISVTSVGSDYEGAAQLQGIYKLVGNASTTSGFPFASGITGCEGVTVSGGGGIDSYNSTAGEYGGENVADNATLQTVYSGTNYGDILYTGGTDLSGDIYATGDVTFTSNSSTVSGSIRSNGTVTLDSATAITGSITARKNIWIKSSTVDYGLLALGDIYLQQSTIKGGVQTHENYEQDGGTVYGGVLVGKQVSLTNWNSNIDGEDLRYTVSGGTFDQNTAFAYHAAPYLVSAEDLPAIDDVPEVPSEEKSLEADHVSTLCDPTDIYSNIAEVVEDQAGLVYETLNISNYNFTYIMENESGEYDNLPEWGKAQATPVNFMSATPLSFITDDTVNMLVYDGVSIEGHLYIEDGHDVTMYVDGDFEMKGNSSLTIPDGSSLTLIITGKIKFGNGQIINHNDSGLTADNNPTFAIYSSYVSTSSDTEPGIIVSGGTKELYAVIYAPLADVEIVSAVNFYGAITGNSVTVSGAGEIHYDEALGDAGPNVPSDGLGDEGFRLVFQGWRFPEAVVSDESDLTGSN